MSAQGDKLKAIADAIREKDGTTEPIAANDFPERIRAIQTGGILPEDVRAISLTAEPENGGTVSGGGVASDGMTVTVNAAPDEANNFFFDCWKEGGVVASTEPLYTFLVSADRNLAAAFVESQYVAGVDWWDFALPSAAYWTSVAYGDGIFVAIAYNTNQFFYSTDGVAWMATTSPSSGTWTSVAYGDGKFVVVSDSSSTKALYSTDGVTWKAATLPYSASWVSVTYGDGKFVAIALSSNRAAYSTDGMKWSAATLPSSASWKSVTYGDGKFVAVANASKVAYSTNGYTWYATTASGAWGSVVYGNGIFVAIPSVKDSNYCYSADGITWETAALPLSDNWSSIAYGDGKFVAVAGAYLNLSDSCIYSKDGLNWETTMLPFAAEWRSVAYGDGKFVAVAKNSGKAACSSAKGPGQPTVIL